MLLRTKFQGLRSCFQFSNPFQLLLAHTLFRSSRFVPHRLNGIDFIADRMGGDAAGLRPCLVGAMYDPFLEFAGALAKTKPLNVADLGANAGGFSLVFAARGIPIQKIAAVEMNPMTYSRMRLNLLTAFGPCAEPINAAIGSTSGKARVPFSFGGTGESFVENPHGLSFEIPTLTFDEFLNSSFPNTKVDILKIDIEGSEWNMVDSPSCTRLKDCLCVIAEVHSRDGRSPDSFHRAMQNWGLKLSTVQNPSAPDIYCYISS